MNIIKSEFSFNFRYLKQPGSYEWIYFDMISDCGNYSMVIIFYCGFPFASRYNNALRNYPDIHENINLSAADFPAVSFCLYENSKKLVNIHKIFGKDKISSENNHIKIGNNLLKMTSENGINKYFLNMNLYFPYRNLSLSSEIEIQEITSPVLDEYNTDFDENHYWSPRSPLCFVKADISVGKRKLTLQGSGYSDRNYGTIPFFHNIKEWFWGRFHSDTVNIIYYHIKYLHHKSLNILLLYDKNGKAEHINNINTEFSRKYNYFFLNYYKFIHLSNRNFIIDISNNTKIDNGPFYIRYLSDFTLNYNGMDLTGKGITEYISPQRLKCRFLYPFINIKIKND